MKRDQFLKTLGRSAWLAALGYAAWHLGKRDPSDCERFDPCRRCLEFDGCRLTKAQVARAVRNQP